MKNVLLLAGLMLMASCSKPNRIERTDCNYIYVWKYDINGDSTLFKYNQPRIVERNVKGGNAKSRNIKADLYNNGCYVNVKVPYKNRHQIIRKARNARYSREPIVGVFKETFYPCHKFEFINYK